MSSPVPAGPPVSEQAAFWEGSFGDEYTGRNRIHWPDRVPFFRQVLARTTGVVSICELGANRGHDLEALHSLNPDFRLTGVEINRKACGVMAGLPFVQVVPAPIQAFHPAEPFDLVVVCGVLIHCGPDDLPVVCQKLFDVSRRYVLINEYFHPVPVELPYRGHSGKLWKRDFGGEFLDRFGAHLDLVDYGFLWKRAEPAWDNTTWWLFEKRDAPGREKNRAVTGRSDEK